MGEALQRLQARCAIGQGVLRTPDALLKQLEEIQVTDLCRKYIFIYNDNTNLTCGFVFLFTKWRHTPQLTVIPKVCWAVSLFSLRWDLYFFEQHILKTMIRKLCISSFCTVWSKVLFNMTLCGGVTPFANSFFTRHSGLRFRPKRFYCAMNNSLHIFIRWWGQTWF